VLSFNPVTVKGLPVRSQFHRLDLEVTVYDVMENLHPKRGSEIINAELLPSSSVPIVGAPGVVAGVALFDVADAGPVPTLLVAVAIKVYVVPLLKPLTVIGLVVQRQLIHLDLK